jgi:hypothetical protein
VHKRIISSVKRVEFVGTRMCYIIRKGPWCHIVLNVLAPADKIDDMKDSFYKKLEGVFEKFPTYHMKSMLGDLDRENNFKPIIGN